ncbi:accessory Sec system protein translocase subunit SecY2 [Streptococcus cameli]
MENIMFKIKVKFLENPVWARGLWTIFFIFVYLVGRGIPISTMPLNNQFIADAETKNLLESLAVFSAGNLSNLTLFSLGVGPWMTSMILWRFFAVFGMLKNKTALQTHRYQTTLAIAIAILQGYGLTMNSTFEHVDFMGGSYPGLVRIMTIVLLASGAAVLVWLGNQNSRLGLGGMMIFIMSNMILSFINNATLYFRENTFEQSELFLRLVLFAAILVVLILIAISNYRSEYRIPIKRIGLANSNSRDSYLPIRMMPAGSMPFMYGISLMMLPLYIVSILLRTNPDNEFLLFLYQNVGISKLMGAIIYICLLYILAIGFAYYNYDSYEIAKSMRQNGDYIESVTPGYDTQRFISRKIGIISQIGALLTVIISGVPLLSIVLSSQPISPALLISNAFVITMLMLGIIEQVESFQMWKKYKDIL